jgi:drug/metabolite transporter (DMT)-like permease
VLPFDYLRIVYAFGIGLWLFGEVPNEYSVGGTAIIVASTLYILIREARQKRQATAAA